jgi:hypothetical protein
LKYDLADPAARALVKNLARMFLTLVSEQDAAGRPRKGTAIMGKTPQRYLGVVIAAHGELGIELSFLSPLARKWAAGYENDVMRTQGVRQKRHKAGITRQLMLDMFRLMDKEKLAVQLKVVLRASMMCAFTNELRRAEFLRKSGAFNRHLHLTRNHVTFFDKHWVRTPTVPASLRRLRVEGGWMLFRPPVLKNDPRGEIWGDSPTPFPIGMCKKKPGSFIDYASWQIDMELSDPIEDVAVRARTPMFVDPRVGVQMTARTFDSILMKLLQGAYKGKGLSPTLDEVRKIYGIHSFRIGGDNAHRAAKTPKPIRKCIGHWRSDVIEEYSRSQLESMSECVENQDIDCPLLQVCDPSMPTYPETKGLALPGTCIIQAGSCWCDAEDSVSGVKAGVIRLKGSEKLPVLVGKKVKKSFPGHGTFQGSIISQGPRWYRIQYEDGDEEDCNANEIQRLLV